MICYISEPSKICPDDTSRIMDVTSEILRFADKVAHAPALSLARTQIMQAVQVTLYGVQVVHYSLHSRRVDIEKEQNGATILG